MIKTKTTISWVCLFILPLAVYFLAFITEFGMHNDYSFLPGNFQDRQMHDEASHQVMIGRTLGAISLNFLTWSVNSVADLAVVRFASFLFMMVFSILFVLFLQRRLGMSTFWATLIALSIMMLSTSQLYVLWATNLPPGFMTLVLASISYGLWDLVRFRKEDCPARLPIFPVAAAVLLFLAALFIYPSNALFVFVCTFSIMIFSSPDKWPQTRRIIGQDVLFFGSIMFVYFLINYFIIFPYAKYWLTFIDVPTGIYKFNLTQDVAGKFSLMSETLLVALAGIWHPVFGNTGAFISAAIIILSGGILASIRQKENRDKISRKGWLAHISRKFFIGTLLFVLINLPPLLAKECYHLVGYRILFPSAVLILIWQFGLLQKCAEGLSGKKKVLLVKALGLGLVICGWGFAFANVYTMSENLHNELNFIRAKVAAIDFSRIDRVMVVMLRDQEKEIVAQESPPFEWNHYRLTPTRMSFIIKELASQRGFPVTVLLDVSDKIFVDANTAIIDCNELFAVSQKKWASQTNKPIGILTASAHPMQQLEVSQVNDSFFRFEEFPAGKELPFWVVNFNEQPWFQVDFIKNPPSLIKGFALSAVDLKLNILPIEFRIQGSFDGTKWFNLDMVSMTDGRDNRSYRVYVLRNFIPFKKYRFYFDKKNLPETIRIAGVWMQMGS